MLPSRSAAGAHRLARRHRAYPRAPQDELQRELEELEQATLDEHVLKIDATADTAAAVNAPAAPSSAIPQQSLPAMPSAPTTKVAETDEVRPAERAVRVQRTAAALRVDRRCVPRAAATWGGCVISPRTAPCTPLCAQERELRMLEESMAM